VTTDITTWEKVAVTAAVLVEFLLFGWAVCGIWLWTARRHRRGY